MVTIADVARHAGVAQSTVSYVLTGKRSISGSTKSRVRASIRELGYHPHLSGRSAPPPGRANALALVTPQVTGAYPSAVMRLVTSVVSRARKHDMDVLLVTADQGAEGLQRVSGAGHVDGFLVIDLEAGDEWAPALRRLSHPSVVIGPPTGTKGLTCVDVGFESGGAACVDHLADLGHRSIGFLGAPSAVYRQNTGFAHRIMTGFSAAAMRRGIETTAMPAEESYDSVLRSVATLLRSRPSTTAIVVHNEGALPWVERCLRKLGRKVPGDLTVAAIGADGAADRTACALASVRLPFEDLGVRAVDLLACKLDGVPVPPLTTLPPQLVERTGSRH